MGIRMNPPEFPAHRRQDPKRGAEARVFDALQGLGLDGHGLYEFRYRMEGQQVDYALWVHDTARFAVQVKGGRYEMDDGGQWLLRSHDGGLERVASPLEETADGCMEMRDGINEATGYKNFVAGVLMFPDMPRHEGIDSVARERHHVHTIWGLVSLEQDLRCVAKAARFRRPPRSRIAETEWSKLLELQYHGAGQDRKDHRTGMEAPGPTDTERQFTFGTATINIQHVETLVIQHFPEDRDADEPPFIPGR